MDTDIDIFRYEVCIVTNNQFHSALLTNNIAEARAYYNSYIEHHRNKTFVINIYDADKNCYIEWYDSKDEIC